MLPHLLLMQLLQSPHTLLDLGELPLAFRTFGPLLIEFELKIRDLSAVLFIGHPEAGPEGLDLIIFEGEYEQCFL